MGPKAIACLRIAALDKMSNEWTTAYQAACAEFSEKAVISKFEQLAGDYYIEYGVSARTGWLTDKGREALARCQ